MEIFALPGEIEKEIFSYTSVRDIANTYEGRAKKKPSKKVLDWIAIDRHLPFSHDIEVLISFEEDLTLPERISYCIQYNDYASFKRLFDEYNSFDINMSFLRPTIQKRKVKSIRPKIVEYILTKSIEKNIFDDKYVEMAFQHQQYDLIDIMLSQKPITLEMYLFDPLIFGQEQVLKSLGVVSKYLPFEHDQNFWNKVLEMAIVGLSADIIAFVFNLTKGGGQIYDHVQIEGMSDEILLEISLMSAYFVMYMLEIHPDHLFDTEKGKKLLNEIIEIHPDIFSLPYRQLDTFKELLAHGWNEYFLTRKEAFYLVKIIDRPDEIIESLIEWLSELIGPENYDQIVEALDKEDMSYISQLSQKEISDSIKALNNAEDMEYLVNYLYLLVEVNKMDKTDAYKHLKKDKEHLESLSEKLGDQIFFAGVGGDKIFLKTTDGRSTFL